MKFKRFNIGETCQYWQPEGRGIYNCMDKRTGVVESIRMSILGKGKEYGIKTAEGNTIYISTSSVSEANGGHYCELGPCASGEYVCQHRAKCREGQ